MAPLNILITGAGIGGNALAFWLSKLNHNVTVVERHHCLRINGLQLDLRGHGIQVMRLMGLEKEVRAKVVPEEGISLVDSKDRQWGWFPANRSGKGAQSFSSEFEIMRCDLCQILHDAAVKHGSKYVFGTYVTSFEERDGVVNVTFANGKTDNYDLVVGADGLGSRLRRLMFVGQNGNTKDSLTELGNRAGYFTIPKPIEKGEQYIATGYLLPGKRFVLTRRHSPTMMQVYLTCEVNAGPPKAIEAVKSMRRGDIKSEKDAFAEMFRDSGWKTDELVKAMQEGAEDWYCQYSGFVKTDRWSKGHVTLLGDAAHGAPADGMGTSAALIGAYILAGEIEKHCGAAADVTKPGKYAENSQKDSILAAIKGYEQKHQPYMKKTQQYLSAEPNMFDKIPSTPFTVSLMLYLAWFASLVRLDVLLCKLIPSESVKGWTLPEYEILKR